MAEKTVEQRCYEALKARGVTFAAAESCTGGLIAKRITDVPGASGVFMGGVVSYTNIVKHPCSAFRRTCWKSTARCPRPSPAQ